MNKAKPWQDETLLDELYRAIKHAAMTYDSCITVDLKFLQKILKILKPEQKEGDGYYVKWDDNNFWYILSGGEGRDLSTVFYDEEEVNQVCKALNQLNTETELQYEHEKERIYE